MPQGWEYSPKDALRLAAIRWFANTIENLSIELYATNPVTFENTEALLKETLQQLKLQREQISTTGQDECPDGYELCGGLCVPSCDPGDLSTPQAFAKE
jgi:ferredoxin